MNNSERTKVIHVVTRLDFGGAQQNTLYTALHLDAKRFDCSVACGEGGTLSPEIAKTITPVIIPALRREISPANDFLAFLQLLNLFYAQRPAIVHTHSSKAGILGRLAAKAAGVPVIIHTYHGFGFHDFMSPRTKRFYIGLERLCASFCSAIIFVSKANQEYAKLHSIGDPQRYRLIRSGIPLDNYPAKIADRGALKKSLGLGLHKLVVTTIGNFKPQKNPGDFIALARQVNAESPETEFYFVGDGPLRSRLEYQIIASNLSGRMRLAGWRTDVAQILAVTDIFVLTSLWEGLPRSLVEAMKTGLPCVCYASDGVKDLIVDGVNGFCLPQGNVSGVAGRVMELLESEALRKKMGEAAAKSIGLEFDIDEMVRAQEDLYDELRSEV